jgi:hypothetical protein
MNPYYAAGFMSALVFWVWPAYLYKTFAAPLPLLALACALSFLGAGRAATELHIRSIAPRNPPKGDTLHIVLLCAAVFATGYITRRAFDLYLRGGA